MLTVRRAAERGRAASGWLDSWYSFSFADYRDPEHTRFSVLRVLNEDHLAPGSGFPEHPHRDVEIITYMLAGSLAHEDSLGNRRVIARGEVQRLGAGHGVWHSETAVGDQTAAHLLQIWLYPAEKGLDPEYECQSIPDEEKRGQLRFIAAPDGRGGSLRLRQQALVFAAILDDGQTVEYDFAPDRCGYLHVALGSIRIEDQELAAGDAVMIDDEKSLQLTGLTGGGELLLFDLPGA